MPALLDDPTLEFMRQFDDLSKWIVKCRVPLFKPHDRMKLDTNTGKQFVAYSVTRNDMPQIAANMRRNQKKGVPARITVGHVSPDGDESEQPRVVGYWLNAQPGTFGPENEPCVYADAYVKRACAGDVKGRPYRSCEYYPATKEIRGAALLTRDPQLDLGTVEIYRVPSGAFLYSAPGECYMADEEKKDEPKAERIGEKPVGEGDPEGHDDWSKHMEHYAKKNAWVGYAMHCYAENQTATAGAPSATDTQIPVVPKKEDDPMSRMTRDDEAVNYARLSAEISELRKARETDKAVIATLTKERDEEKCERMVRTMQAEGYQFKESTPDLVKKLVAKTTEARDEMVTMLRQYCPRGLAPGEMIETYSGRVETEKPDASEPTPEQCRKLALQYRGDPEGYDKALGDLRNGTAVKN